MRQSFRLGSTPELIAKPATMSDGSVLPHSEPDELAVLGSMEFEVVPAERTDTQHKKVVEKTLPEIAPQPRVPPNHVYVELPPTPEDDIMKDIEEKAVPSSSKQKQKEFTAESASIEVSQTQVDPDSFSPSLEPILSLDG